MKKDNFFHSWTLLNPLTHLQHDATVEEPNDITNEKTFIFSFFSPHNCLHKGVLKRGLRHKLAWRVCGWHDVVPTPLRYHLQMDW